MKKNLASSPDPRPRLRHTTFRKVLRTVLKERVARNTSYSQRAFARDLGSSAATLAEYLGGRRSISWKLAKRWAEKLRLKGDISDSIFGRKATTYMRVDPDGVLVRELKRHWYYFPILSLIEFADATVTTKVVAKRLGLRVNVARRAVACLVALGMLHESETGILKPTGQRYSVASFSKETLPYQCLLEKFALNTLALKRFQRLSLKERRRAYECSDFSTVVFGVDLQQIVELKERLAKFRRNLAEFAEAGRPTEVYQLSLGLIPLTKGVRTSASLSLKNPRQRYVNP